MDKKILPAHETDIPVTIEKSHLSSIGERLYAESVELIRELVNNAYDADATEVRVTISEHEISVADNGTGMDVEGLKQYFKIGGSQKRKHPKSLKFQRDRIGEFGIGKFSTLSAADYFEVNTKKGDFSGTVVFDRKLWEESRSHWRLPLRLSEPVAGESDGTKVVLRDLKKTFDLGVVERRMLETLPLQVENFAVYLNEKKLEPRTLEGRRIPILEGTAYGVIHGELVIRPAIRGEAATAGIVIRIKQVAVARLPFDLEGESLARITGEIHADFLPITSDRTGFIRDTAEFNTFEQAMLRILKEARQQLSHLSDQKENGRIKRAMKEVMEKIQQALVVNSEWCPPAWLPEPEKETHASTTNRGGDTRNLASVEKKEHGKPKKRTKRIPLRRLSPSAMIKKMRMGRVGFALVLDHFGTERPESFTEGDIIYINRDHPLYLRESMNRERHIMHVARLIGQEIALMSHPRNAREAFERQSRLLRDAFRSVEKTPA